MSGKQIVWLFVALGIVAAIPPASVLVVKYCVYWWNWIM